MAAMSTRAVLGQDFGSLERIRAGVGVPRTAAVRQIAGAFVQDFVFDEPIITDTALGGHHNLTIRRDGSFRYHGHLRATGFPSFEVAIATTLGYDIAIPGSAPGAAQVAFAAHGEVHGTNEFGDRQFGWDQQGHLPLLAAEWENVRRGRVQRRLEFDTDFFGTAGGVVSFLGQVVALGALFGAGGVAIVLAGEAAHLANFNELVLPGTVGLLLASGAAFVFGPGVLIPAFIVGAAVTAATVKQRPLTGPERTFADQVFRGKCPYDRVMLTNLVGFGGRPFASPGPGETILVNIGEGFHDPVNYTGKGGTEPNQRAAGQLLIHELTHAWQIANESFTPAYYCRALSTSIGTTGGDMSAYAYGPAGPPWGSFGTEQQAAIVDGWFAGSMAPELVGRAQPQRAFPPMHDRDQDPNVNPYYRYIRDNIRAGIA